MSSVSGLNHSNEFANENPQQRELLRVCRIGRAQGIKGEVNVWAFTDEPELRFAPGAVLIDSHDKEFRVIKSRQFKKRWIILFEHVSDRNAAEALNGTELYCEADSAEEMEDEEAWYPSDLIGLEVRLDSQYCEEHELDAGVSIAQVSDVLDGVAQSLLELKSIDADAEADGPVSVLIPFVEEIVPEIDLEHGYIRIDPPSGLLPDAMLDAAKNG
ncbi:ribosome maturation factor RimM [Bifidobacterium aquikefiri]|uniref:Ribosome maturation factor RimM n=1 Tax=Bifidobacterium aquikefiri TaxID=1653207 RepID=A0A261G3R7_9BIFI|nr:ribosome maturation protein RimM [Bifidobacterium aquikefiri]